MCRCEPMSGPTLYKTQDTERHDTRMHSREKRVEPSRGEALAREASERDTGILDIPPPPPMLAASPDPRGVPGFRRSPPSGQPPAYFHSRCSRFLDLKHRCRRKEVVIGSIPTP